MQSPEQVIQACLSGDEAAKADAYAALFDQYKGLVYRTAYLMLDSGDGYVARDAEDTLQDVFTQVFRSLHTYDAARSALSTWLHRITVNACLTRHRKARRPAPLPLDDDGGSEPIAAEADPLLRLSLADQAQHLLGALDDDQRAVVILRFYWDLSYQEIAEITGTPLGTVQSRFGRALRKMRAVMAAMQEEEKH